LQTFIFKFLSRFTQLAAAHCQIERTLDPADPPMPQLAPLWPSPRNVLRYFSSQYYQVVIATHLPTPVGWKLSWPDCIVELCIIYF